MVDMPQVADGRQRELRLALSMNGGVSLAVWIGGAVSEIDVMRRAEKGSGASCCRLAASVAKRSSM